MASGNSGVAIGVAGLPALIDLRGRPDLFGRTLEVSVIGFADEVAAAASLLMGQADEASPVVLVRGLRWSAPEIDSGQRRSSPQMRICFDEFGILWSRSPAASVGAKLALGLSRIVKADNLLVVANVGDDFEHLGLHISPDADTLMYTLAGLDNTKLGWGRQDETWAFMETLSRSAATTGFVLAIGTLRFMSSAPVGWGRARVSPSSRPTFAAASAWVPVCCRRRTSGCAPDCERMRDGSISRTISCAFSAARSCASLTSTARTRRALIQTFWRRWPTSGCAR